VALLTFFAMEEEKYLGTDHTVGLTDDQVAERLNIFGKNGFSN
jgi:hypothetical protein